MLNPIDLQIVKILRENGRITNLQLSNEIGLSPGPTLERVRKLEKTGVIKGYHADVDYKKVGIGIQAFIQVNLARQLDNAINEFLRKIQEIDEIITCYQVTGTFDYQLLVLVPDMDAFNTLISEKLSKIEEIGQMQSYFILSKVKETQTIPLVGKNAPVEQD